ncbi:putative NAD-binding protein [Lyophyllum shimeji]|uniref:NAD-binding protein n=1 Tax=Lyophyllum shimeji TaxID=47721 RepID=A0A9P3PFY8_LYOSH|nr:putative NAD-binding protein [Lyophyllum shimeji]
MLSSTRAILSRASHRLPRHPAPLSVLRPLSTLRPLHEQAKPTLPTQSVSPHAPVGVDAALRAASDPSFTARPKVFDEFALTDRVAIVSGANRGLGLEMALVLAEAGARAVYCIDLPKEPADEWKKTSEYVRKMGGGRRMEYVCEDVRDQKGMWARAREIGDKEGRMDVCVAAAGILKNHTDCLEYPADQFQEVLDVNTKGVLYTAQAAGQQMRRFGNGGSIVLIASMSGSITNKDHAWVSYNSSKSAVLQMARSMACELGRENIRVNSLSPGHIYTNMTAAYLDSQPHLLEKWSSLNPMGRIVSALGAISLSVEVITPGKHCRLVGLLYLFACILSST